MPRTALEIAAHSCPIPCIRLDKSPALNCLKKEAGRERTLAMTAASTETESFVSIRERASCRTIPTRAAETAVSVSMTASDRSRLIWPLGMSNTAIFLTEEQEEARAMPHDASGQPVSQWDYAALQSAGGVKSTTYDLMLYLAANMGQIPVETETLVQGMQEAQKVWFDDGETVVGLGLRHGESAGKQVLWQSGMTGGYGSYIGFVPETGTGVAVLCNSAIDVEEIGAQILSLMQE